MKKFLIVLVLSLCLLFTASAQATPQEDFFILMAPAAQDILPGYGLWPSVFLAQCAQESGYGTSYLATHANNYFGRKCSYSPCVEITTTEYRDGQKTSEVHWFQVYSTMDEAIHDYAKNYLRKWKDETPVYKMDASTPFTFINSVAKTYATDPNYAKKIISLIVEYNLERFDQREDERSE